MGNGGGISQLEIRASRFSFKNSGGLCGYYDQNENNDNFIWNNENGVNVRKQSDIHTVAEFWR